MIVPLLTNFVSHNVKSNGMPQIKLHISQSPAETLSIIAQAYTPKTNIIVYTQNPN
jgi:hypothetical protein